MATVIIKCDGCGKEWDTEAFKAWHTRAIANAREAGWKCDDWIVANASRKDWCPDCVAKQKPQDD